MKVFKGGYCLRKYGIRDTMFSRKSNSFDFSLMCFFFLLFLGENGEILEAAQKAESFIKELEDMQNSVVSNDSPILSSNLKSLQDLKAESPNKKLDRESLKQVSLICFIDCEKDRKFEKKTTMKILFFKFFVAISNYFSFN